MRLGFFLKSVLSLFVLNNAAYASINMAMWPINQHINTGKDSSVLWLRNTGDNNANLSVRIFSWNQKDGDDVFSDQSDISIIPPIIGILPGDKQYLRFFTNSKKNSENEKAYKIIIDELPSVSPGNSKIAMRMRYVLPLFVEGKNTPQSFEQNGDQLPDYYPVINWHYSIKNGKKVIALQNTGPVHARLSDIQVDSEDGKLMFFIKKGLYGYILPNSTMYVSVKQNIDISPKEHLSALFFDGNSKPCLIKRN